MKVAATRADLLAALGDDAAVDATCALVPTMGALHRGHAALIRTARDASQRVVVSIFVNPLQFGPLEDLANYPRPLTVDLEMCETLGVDIAFAPDVATVYPDGDPMVTVDPGPVAEILEGASRAGHFRGVLTVVAKLFGLVRPDAAVFGEKDYQQLVLVRRMVGDLCLPIDVIGVDIVRDDDDLALSSRNRYLTPTARASALALSRAMRAGQGAAEQGVACVLNAAERVLVSYPEVDVDYLALRGTDLRDAPPSGQARLLVAGKVGGTRLLDNVPVVIGRTVR
ncbi:MAG: pantoate--beta-alanine ligase [Nocardioidaceae bacterium]